LADRIDSFSEKIIFIKVGKNKKVKCEYRNMKSLHKENSTHGFAKA